MIRFAAILAVLVVAWVHGCIGLYFWLRMRPFFKRAAPFLLAGAVLIPTLAMLGIYQAGRATIADYQDPDWRREELSVQKLGTAAQGAMLEKITDDLTIGYLGLLGLVLVRRLARRRCPVLAHGWHGPGHRPRRRAGGDALARAPALGVYQPQDRHQYRQSILAS
mgnify:CR=1 FL=1